MGGRRPKGKRGFFLSPKEDLVLVVDDEEPVRDIVSKLVKHIGYPVIEAANGEEALDP